MVQVLTFSTGMVHEKLQEAGDIIVYMRRLK